ncbi:MAG: hypothetical protein Q9160_004161 [Pyrenula sp. 1 TL-2023]
MPSRWEQSTDWRASSAPSRGCSPQTSTPIRAYPSPPRSSTPRREMGRDWRDRSPPSSEGKSTRSFSPSSSVSSTDSQAYSTTTTKQNAPFAERPFEIVPFEEFAPYHLDGADKAEDFEQQLAFAHHRIKHRGNPGCKGNRAVRAKIHDWWHTSKREPKVHLTIDYMNKRDGNWKHHAKGGDVYIRLHVYRTDKEERA